MDKQDKNSTYRELEDVDRSCVHVITVIGVVFAVLAYIIYPAGIFDIPFATLTAGVFFRLIGSVILAILAILIFIDVADVFKKR